MQPTSEILSETISQSSNSSGNHCNHTLRARRSVAATALLGVALLVVGAGISQNFNKGHAADSLAGFRRWDMDEGDVVELVGESPAIDGFNCFLDTTQGILRVTASVLTFRDMPTACAVLSVEAGRAYCAATFNSAMLNFILIASMVGQAVSDCQGSLVWPAACTAGVTGFMAALEVFPMSVAGIMLTCNQWWRTAHITPYGVTTTAATTAAPTTTAAATTAAPTTTTRMPWRDHFTTGLPPNLPTLVPSSYWYNNVYRGNYRASIAKCVAYTGLAMTFLGRAAILLMDTAKFCHPSMQVIKAAQGRCATDIVTVFATASILAQFLAASVTACAGAYSSTDHDIYGAACATYILGISTSVFASAPVAVKLPVLCPKMLWTSTLPPEPTPVPTPKWLTTAAPAQ